MRLDAVEIVNWGTFDKQIWRFDLGGENALLTGDIGSGKSTLVDAITSLLVPAQKISFNKAAGADSRERDLRSYVLGHYKSERSDEGLSAKPVALRDHSSFSVLLARFRNEAFNEIVTLAQVLWFKETHGQPARFYVVADQPLSIAEHFSHIGKDIGALRQRLRRLPRLELHDRFPSYSAAFRRRFGIESEQALELFHQTVSMKAVGDLTDFVRVHMLEPFPVDDRIQHMITHFEDLTRAHEAVLKARAQIESLTPIVKDCDAYAALAEQIDGLRGSREALRAFFAQHKILLLDNRMASLTSEIAKLDDRITKFRERRREQDAERDGLKQAILENGGDRIVALQRDIEARQATRQERQDRARQYRAIADSLGIAEPTDAEQFHDVRASLESELEDGIHRQAEIQNKLTEQSVEMKGLRGEYDELEQELQSLRSRRSNIPSRMLAIRENLAAALSQPPESFPFAGELIEVREDERAWEGAAERLLHGFALSLLVSDASYSSVAKWVDATHLGIRMVYYRVTPRPRAHRGGQTDDRAISHKLAVKEASVFYDWLQKELDERFVHICCKNIDEFRREETAITLSGQTKVGGRRHDKDDRSRLDDRAIQAQLVRLESEIKASQEALDQASDERPRQQERWKVAETLRTAASLDLEAVDTAKRAALFPALEALRGEAFGETRLSIESCEAREREMRAWLQSRIDGETQKLTRVRDRIIAAMRDYAHKWPEDTRETDTTIEATDEYRRMLSVLESDGLPRFEKTFKSLLKENAINEVASFQSQLRREVEEIRERITVINRSLYEIDYAKGRYIQLEPHPTSDFEIRDFQGDLRACTENTLTGSDDDSYSEQKFIEVKRIIERFRGREGSTELDKRWTRKVTDVRNWFVFSASERWRSDDSEHEHYSDSGGKSGGQKEKLAYTILAASLAYQFGIDSNAPRSRAFHFVVIDEAFGRGSDDSARFGLELFKTMGLQLLIVTPLQKIHIIEPYVAAVGFVENKDGNRSRLLAMTIEEYRTRKLQRAS
jgi:uncharacterized protein YPO0396